MSWVAVLGPIPLTPGILSDWSPMRAMKSVIWLGVIPILSLTSFSLYKISLGSFKTRIDSSTNCKASLSPVTTTVSIPSFFTLWERVAIKSSASYPSFSKRARFNASTILLARGIWLRSSSGARFLVALYSSYSLCRKVGAG